MILRAADRSIIKTLLASSVFRRPGGWSEESTPDPIPNSAVKLFSANGTVSQDPGEEVIAGPAKDRSLFIIF